MTFLVGWGCCKLTFRITEVGNNIHLIKCLYLRMIKLRCALPQKNLTESISAYAYLFMLSFFGGGGEKWGMKDEKNNDRRGCLGSPPRSQRILMPEKEMEIIFVTPLWIHKWNFDPPPPFGVELFSWPPAKKNFPAPAPTLPPADK